MQETFESVLKQAEKLSDSDKARLISELSGPAPKRVARSKSARSAVHDKKDDRDKAVIRALREWVDEIASSPDPKRRTSARIAERIRKKNDRGYTL